MKITSRPQTQSLIRSHLRTLPLLVGALLTVGCQTSQPVSPVESSNEIEVIGVPPMPNPPTGEKISPMEKWLARWFVYGSDNSMGPVVFDPHEMEVRAHEWNAGMKEYLGDQSASDALVAGYRDRLEQDLLVMRWLAGSDLGNDPEFLGRMRYLLRQKLVEMTLEERLKGSPVPEAELLAAYESKRDIDMPERADVRFILVPTEAEALRIEERLEARENFEELAREFSRHEASRQRGGRMDPFVRGTYNPDFEDRAFEMTPGARSTVSTSLGVFVIEKIAHIKGGRIPFAQLRPQLEAEYRTRQRAALIQQIRAEVER